MYWTDRLGWSLVRWSRWSRWSGWLALMICIQKIYGFRCLNHQIIEESWDVTPVTNGRTDGRRTESGRKCSVLLDQKPQNLQSMEWMASIHPAFPSSSSLFQGTFSPLSPLKMTFSSPIESEMTQDGLPGVRDEFNWSIHKMHWMKSFMSSDVWCIMIAPKKGWLNERIIHNALIVECIVLQWKCWSQLMYNT